MLRHYITGFSSITKWMVGFIEGTQPKVHFRRVSLFVLVCVFAVMFRLFEDTVCRRI